MKKLLVENAISSLAASRIHDGDMHDEFFGLVQGIYEDIEGDDNEPESIFAVAPPNHDPENYDY